MPLGMRGDDTKTNKEVLVELTSVTGATSTGTLLNVRTCVNALVVLPPSVVATTATSYAVNGSKSETVTS